MEQDTQLQQNQTLDQKAPTVSLSDEDRQHARSVLEGTTAPPESALEEPLPFNETPDWQNLSEAQKNEKIGEVLQQMGASPEDAKEVLEQIQEVKALLKTDESTLVNQTEDLTVASEIKEKKNFSTGELAGIGLLLFLDLSMNGGRGVSDLFEEILHNKLAPQIMEKLGFDQTIIESFRGRKDLLRGLLQMKDADLRLFLNNSSKYQIIELLESMDENDRQLLISEGSLENRRKLLDQREIKHFFLDKLSGDEITKLKLKQPESVKN